MVSQTKIFISDIILYCIIIVFNVLSYLQQLYKVLVMTKLYTFRCEKLSFSLKKEIDTLKQNLRCSSNNKLLNLLVRRYVILKEDTESKINTLCDEKKYSRQNLLSPIIEKYINKTLKSYGVVKEPNQKTLNADNEMNTIINDIIKYYDAKPEEERKYLTPSMINKFLYKNEDKYSTKHVSVIKRALITHSEIIDNYHNKNKLNPNSNYFNRKSKTNQVNYGNHSSK